MAGYITHYLSTRYSSSPAKTAIWIKHNGSQAIRVCTADCEDISDLAKAIKRELPNQLSIYSYDQLTLHKTLNDAPLRPGLKIDELSKFGEPNTDEAHLFVKTQESITTTQKTIFVLDIDGGCRPLDSFTKVIVENNDDVKQIFEGNGEALYQLSNPKVRVTKMKQLIDGERYNVYSRYKQCLVRKRRWQISRRLIWRLSDSWLASLVIQLPICRQTFWAQMERLLSKSGMLFLEMVMSCISVKPSII